MAATVTVSRWTGPSGNPTKTDITNANTRANAEDTHTTSGTANSVLIPIAGTNYSYWVSTRLAVSAINSGTVDNFNWYTDGSNNFGTGVNCIGTTATSYIQATGTIGTSGTQLTTANHPGLTGSPVDVFSFTVNAPKIVSGTISTTGDAGDFFVYQITVDSTASSGATAAETFTWKYDDSSS